MSNKIKITIYNDIIKESSYINAWTINECFPVNKVNNTELYDKFCVIEITFEGTHGDNSKYNKIKNDFNFILKKYLCLQEKSIYYFEIGEKGLKSKIRTYKGIFENFIPKKDYLQKEYDLDENYSIFSGLLNYSEERFPFVKNRLSENSNSFIRLTNEDIYSIENIDDTYYNNINHEKYVVDYLKLCLNYCSKHDIIIRENGDGGDQEFSWQFILKKDNLEKTLFYINKVIPSQRINSDGDNVPD